MPDLTRYLPLLQFILAALGAYLVALWFALIFWTYRDIQSRTKDILVQILATLFVAVFTFPGLILYLILRPKDTLDTIYQRTIEEEFMLQDLETREICPNCRARVKEDFLYCPNCRTALKRECQFCHKQISVNYQHCPYCGK